MNGDSKQHVETIEVIDELEVIAAHISEAVERLNKVHDFICGARWTDEFQLSELRVALLKRLPYADYLNTSHWKKTRAQALEKSSKCAVCGTGGRYFGDNTLEVHHRTYERLGQEKPEDLVVLCHTCHSRVHNKAVKTRAVLEEQ